MGGNTQISNNWPQATERVNTTDVRTPILDFTPKDGTGLIVYNSADGSAGVPIYASLQDSNGDDLPVDTEVVLTFESSIDDSPSAVSDVQHTIQPWRARAVADQQNEEYIDSVRVPLKGRRLVVTDVDTMSVEIDSSSTIDWSRSALYFDKRHVEITSWE